MDPYQIVRTFYDLQLDQLLSQNGAELRKSDLGECVYLIKFSDQTKIDQDPMKYLKGLIFNPKTGYIYAIGYPVPTEFKDLPPEQQTQVVEKIKQRPYKVQEALDGTLIRLWYNHELNQWVTSTNGVVNAYQSIWMNNISYGSLFASTVGYQLSQTCLNPDYIYLFILCHPLNVIVVNHQTARVYHVTTYDRKTLKEVSVDLGIEHSPLYDLTIDQVLTRIASTHGKPVQSAGYMVVQEDEKGYVQRYRFENVNYTRARQLRGNTNNVSYLILDYLLKERQAHVPPESSQLQEFLQYYPIYLNLYQSLINSINHMTILLYQLYGQRYKQNVDIFLHPRLHKTVIEIHNKIYLEKLRPEHKTIKLHDIEQYLYSLPTAKLLSLIHLGGN